MEQMSDKVSPSHAGLSLWQNQVIMPDGTIKTMKFAFGPDWVAEMSFVDDYGFETAEDAVLDWYHNIFHGSESDEAVLEWFNRYFKEVDHDTDTDAEDNTEVEESCGHPGAEESCA